MVVGWPLFDLIIKTPVLELRMPTDNEVENKSRIVYYKIDLSDYSKVELICLFET